MSRIPLISDGSLSVPDIRSNVAPPSGAPIAQGLADLGGALQFMAEKRIELRAEQRASEIRTQMLNLETDLIGEIERVNLEVAREPDPQRKRDLFDAAMGRFRTDRIDTIEHPRIRDQAASMFARKQVTAQAGNRQQAFAAQVETEQAATVGQLDALQRQMVNAATPAERAEAQERIEQVLADSDRVFSPLAVAKLREQVKANTLALGEQAFGVLATQMTDEFAAAPGADPSILGQALQGEIEQRVLQGHDPQRIAGIAVDAIVRSAEINLDTDILESAMSIEVAGTKLTDMPQMREALDRGQVNIVNRAAQMDNLYWQQKQQVKRQRLDEALIPAQLAIIDDPTGDHVDLIRQVTMIDPEAARSLDTFRERLSAPDRQVTEEPKYVAAMMSDIWNRPDEFDTQEIIAAYADGRITKATASQLMNDWQESSQWSKHSFVTDPQFVAVREMVVDGIRGSALNFDGTSGAAAQIAVGNLHRYAAELLQSPQQLTRTQFLDKVQERGMKLLEANGIAVENAEKIRSLGASPQQQNRVAFESLDALNQAAAEYRNAPPLNRPNTTLGRMVREMGLTDDQAGQWLEQQKNMLMRKGNP